MTFDDISEFVIAALGASAGGLEPLETFFKQMPAEPGIAFVIIQHLAPDHETALPQLLARRTEMPVEQARDNTHVVPNRVYVIPPNATLTIKSGVLHVAAPAEPRGSRTPIDSFFTSLAEDRGENAVCIMLSGTGTDGTLGLTAIKEYGGMAMAQTLETAQYDAILRSAIATGLVDHVLPVEAMPAKLLEYAAHLRSANETHRKLNEQIAPNLTRIHGLLHRRTGHDFSLYKESTIARRLERRMKALQIETVEQYVQALERQPEEADRLFNDLLIGVTHFFRDAEAFAALGHEVIPKIFDGKGADGQVRVCVVGCATGEEAYSIAILLSEYASTRKDPPKIQIFATDIDDRSLAVARKGRFPESIAEHVSSERLERFFVKDDNAYQAKRELRELCLFSSHSFIKDPPFSRLDLISCRNVMIYLGSDLQQRMLPLFHYALRSGGYLFLGLSESVASHRELFATVDKKHRIFQRKATVPRPAVKFPLGDINRPKPPGGKAAPDVDERHLAKQLERLVMERYGPACVIVKENGDAVYFSARINKYLQQPAGSPETNVVNMARDGLRIPLRASLHKAVTARERVVQKQISVQTNDLVSLVDLAVEPLTAFQADLYLIVFEEGAQGRITQPGAPAFNPSAEETIRHLEDELRSAHEQAQSAYEELESSNEELQSANEEFQSTNEELETSKEELQSFNEELETVNSELNRKILELDHVNSDLRNLLDSTQIATVFLDMELRIKKFTPSAGALFRLMAGDVGRPIADMAAQFTEVDLVTDANEVLRTLSSRERQLTTAGGRHFQMCMLPYRTVNNVIEGVVLTFIDVSQIRQSEQLAQYARTYAENIIRTIREPLLVLDASLRVQTANQSFYDVFLLSASETENALIYELGNGMWDVPELRRVLGDVLPEKQFQEFQVERAFPHLGHRTLLMNARQIQAKDGDVPLILLAIEDITERKRGEAVQYSLDGIISADLNGLITSWNRGAERMFGYSAEEMFGHTSSVIIPPGQVDETAVIERVKRGETIEQYETVRRAKSGNLLTVSITWSPIRDAKGRLVGTANVVRDITAHKHMEEQRLELLAKERALASERALRETEAELARVVRGLSVGELATSIAHEINQPLAGVVSNAEAGLRWLSAETPNIPEARESLSLIARDGNRASAVIRRIREFLRKQAPQHASLDVNEVVQGALDIARAELERRGIVLRLDLRADLSHVWGDRIQLQQVVLNLAMNGADAMASDEGPKELFVTSERSADGFSVVAVRDTGVGINPNDIPRMFDAFFTTKPSGMGMGLAISRSIIEAHGGRISATPNDGPGLTLRFGLPVEAADHSAKNLS